jgi:hypothetical protein
MRKRAVAVNFVVIMVLSILTIIALTGGTYAYIKIFKKGTSLEACRLSVVNADRLKLMGQTPVNIECPRSELTIKFSDTELKGKFHQDTALQLIAQEMNNCWYKMSGEKQLNPYDQDMVFGPKQVCLICSEISFDQEMKDKVDKVTGLRQFLDREGYLAQWAEPLKVRKGLFIVGLSTVITLEYDQPVLKEIDEFDTDDSHFIVYMTFANTWPTDSRSLPNIVVDKLLQGKLNFFLSADTYSIMYIMPAKDFSYLGCDTVKG